MQLNQLIMQTLFLNVKLKKVYSRIRSSHAQTNLQRFPLGNQGLDKTSPNLFL